MSQIILTTPEQLDVIVQNAIKKVLPDKEEEKKQNMPDSCSVDQALQFLLENGYKMSKSKLYKMTANRDLPFKYFGRRIIFSRSELLEWVEQQSIPSSNPDVVLLNIAKDARRKSGR